MSDTTDCIEQITYPRVALRPLWFVNRDIKRFLSDLRTRGYKGLNLGAGRSRIPGLINCDLFDGSADLKVDATDLSMFDDDSIDLIESHHMIEHLSFADTEKAFKEWHRVLRPRGILVITCPDITRLCVKWLKYSMLNRIFPCPKKMDYLVRMFVGSQKNDGMFHKSVFDYKRLSRVLSRHGFAVEFSFAPFPQRPTPSMLVIARKSKCDSYRKDTTTRDPQS